MIFLIKPDFNISIDEDILDELIEYPFIEEDADPTTDEQELIDAAMALLDLGENAAIEEATGYLTARYLTDEIFNKTGSDRNGMIIMRVVDIALYHIHARLNPKEIPEIRAKRYDDAIKWFLDVNSGIINPPGLPKPEDNSKAALLFGSNKKRDHYF